MYPRLSDLFPDLLGIPAPVPIYSFGVMVATAILLGTWLGARELDRKYAHGEVGGVALDAGTGEQSPSVLVGTLAVLAAGWASSAPSCSRSWAIPARSSWTPPG